MHSFDIEKFLYDLNKKYLGKKIFLFSMGLLVSALAFNLFFNPYDVIPVGSNGLALIIGQFVSVDISLVILIVNLILLIIGLVFFGFDYSLKMLAVTFLYPFFVTTTTLITRYVDLENTSLFLVMVFGGGMLGLSSGLVRKSGYSPGGFCVLYDLMYKYLHISIGTASTIINLILIVCSGFIMGFPSAVYAIISLLVSSYIVDRVIIGISDNKVFYIITKKPLDVKDYIVDKLNYSVTVIPARGGYSNKKKTMLMCVVPTIEYVRLKELVRKIDKDVFFLIVDVYDSSVKKNCKNV